MTALIITLILNQNGFEVPCSVWIVFIAWISVKVCLIALGHKANRK